MKIEKNVPLPSRIAKRYRIGALPLKDMNPGDSLFIEINESDAEISRILHSLRVRLGRFASKNPKFRFSSSKEAKGVRIWRSV
jgi:hypothetical protein